MKRQSQHNLKHMKEIRRSLRRLGTPAEKKLWFHLRRRQLLGKKFRRQYSIGNYVIDFYCPELLLGIELDGAGHYSVMGQINDDIRSEELKKGGVQLLRFENETIFYHIEMVLEDIQDAMRAKMLEK